MTTATRDADDRNVVTPRRARRRVALLATGLVASSLAATASGSVGAVPGSVAPTDLRQTIQPTTHPAAGGRASGVETEPCALELADRDRADASAAMAVLVDGSTSAADQADRLDALVDLIDDATNGHDVAVSVGSFGGSDADVRFAACLDGQIFAPEGNNARTRERNRDGLLDDLSAVLLGLPSGHDSTDPVSALRAGVQRIGAADVDDGPRVVVLHTDGIATSGCASLGERVTIDEPGIIDTMVERCVDDGRLPDASGIHIVIAGIGRTGSDIGADSVTFLLDFNAALCEATGATCHVDPNLPPELWPAENETADTETGDAD